LRNSLLIIKTLAVASLDLMARNAEKAAVPPPIIRYGTCLGRSAELGGPVDKDRKDIPLNFTFCRPFYLCTHWLMISNMTIIL